MLDVDSGRHSVSSLTSIVSTTSSLDGDGAGSGRKSDVRGRSPSGSVVPDLNVDEALERVGFGAFHLRLTLVAGCFWVRPALCTELPAVPAVHSHTLVSRRPTRCSFFSWCCCRRRLPVSGTSASRKLPR